MKETLEELEIVAKYAITTRHDEIKGKSRFIGKSADRSWSVNSMETMAKICDTLQCEITDVNELTDES